MSCLGPGMVVIAFLDFEVVVMSYCPDEMVVIAFPHLVDCFFLLPPPPPPVILNFAG